MSFRRQPASMIARVKAGAKAGAAASIAAATAVGLPIGVLDLPILVEGAMALTVLPVGLVSAYVSGRVRGLPDEWVNNASVENNYVCKPCTATRLREANSAVAALFRENQIAMDRLEQWRLKNPLGFMQIENENGDLVGCFVLIGLHASFFRQFINGNVTEQQISGEDVLTMKETKKQDNIYFSGLMILEPGSFLGAKRFRVLLYFVLRYLKHHFGMRRHRHIYAVALSEEARKVLLHLNFSKVGTAEARTDRHDFFRVDFVEENYDRILSQTGELSSCCKIVWQ